MSDITDAQSRSSPAQPIARTPALTAALLAMAATAGFFALLGLLACREIPAGSRDLVNIMLGALASGWTAILSYYFGSSVGHDRAMRSAETPSNNATQPME